MRSRHRIHWIVALACISLAGHAVPQQQQARVVPPDRSFSPGEYQRLGIRDPHHDWSNADYQRALQALGEIERENLPRYGSESSGLLFTRLLASEAEWLRTDPEARASAGAPLSNWSLRLLFGKREDDPLLFDRELLEVTALFVRAVAEGAPSRAELERQIAEFQRTLPSTDGAANTIRMTEGLRDLVDSQLAEDLGAIIDLIRFDETRPQTRSAAVRHLQELVPNARAHLSEESQIGLAGELEGAAESPVSKDVRPELVSIMKGLGSETP